MRGQPDRQKLGWRLCPGPLCLAYLPWLFRDLFTAGQILVPPLAPPWLLNRADGVHCRLRRAPFCRFSQTDRRSWRSEAATIPRGQVKQEQDELTSNCQPPAVLAVHQRACLAAWASLRVLGELPDLTSPEQILPHTVWKGQAHGPPSHVLWPLW